MSAMSDLHQMLVERGLDPFEGISFADLKKLQQENVISDLEAGIISLSCPEWQKLKQEFCHDIQRTK